jgi:putative ABC transport system permease protein
MAVWEVLYIYRARLRARLMLVQELLAVVGIAVGVALLFASQVASTSLNGSVAQLTSQIVGRMPFQIWTRSPQGLEQRLLAEVRSIPGCSPPSWCSNGR